MNASRRALFCDVQHACQLDLFIGSFEMCHRVPIADRFGVDLETGNVRPFSEAIWALLSP